MNYIENLLDLITTTPMTPGTVHHVYVRHDDACPVLRGRKECTCKNPVVEIGETPRQTRSRSPLTFLLSA